MNIQKSFEPLQRDLKATGGQVNGKRGTGATTVPAGHFLPNTTMKTWDAYAMVKSPME